MADPSSPIEHFLFAVGALAALAVLGWISERKREDGAGDPPSETDRAAAGLLYAAPASAQQPLK